MDIRTWGDLKLTASIAKAINELGFTTVTPVQGACIPIFLKKKDVAVEAVTGSGKTLAFLIPLLEILLMKGPFKKNDVAALIVSPTQELAIQISEVLEIFLRHVTQFTSMLLIGGDTLATVVEKFQNKGANIIVGTPGRLVDLLSRKHGDFVFAQCLKPLEILILDEADKLLELGFESSLNTILSFLPKQRLTGLFSATQTKDVEDLIRAGLRNPVCISVKEKDALQNVQRTPSTLSNFYMIAEADTKFNVLVWFLRSKPEGKNMVFFSTCASVDYFSAILTQLLPHTTIMCIHGKLKNKSRRREMFSRFREIDSGILLCTDVMARGVDIPDVHWVIQYDPPSYASAFVHRCGRTARIGKTGNALMILLPNEETYVDFLAVNQKVTVQKMDCPDVVDVTKKVKKLASKQRELYEKGMRAFVSYIRFYTKHECNLLFRLKDLNLGQLATGFSLLKLPRMPELKGKTPSGFEVVDLNFDNIPYKDKHREKARQIKLKQFKENPTSQRENFRNKKKEERWSIAKKLKSKERQAKKGKKRKQTETAEDLEELARDARLLKKLKRKKITKEEFDARFAPDEEEL